MEPSPSGKLVVARPERRVQRTLDVRSRPAELGRAASFHTFVAITPEGS